MRQKNRTQRGTSAKGDWDRTQDKARFRANYDKIKWDRAGRARGLVAAGPNPA